MSLIGDGREMRCDHLHPVNPLAHPSSTLTRTQRQRPDYSPVSLPTNYINDSTLHAHKRDTFFYFCDLNGWMNGHLLHILRISQRHHIRRLLEIHALEITFSLPIAFFPAWQKDDTFRYSRQLTVKYTPLSTHIATISAANIG